MRSLSTTLPGDRDTHVGSRPVDPDRASIAWAAAIALAVVVLTRLPVARGWAIESDEFGFLDQMRLHWFPMHHTLYLSLGRVFGMLAGDPYRGLILLNMTTSALALVSLWWFLRALAAPADSGGRCPALVGRSGFLGLWCDRRQLHGDCRRGRLLAWRGLSHASESSGMAPLRGGGRARPGHGLQARYRHALAACSSS